MSENVMKTNQKFAYISGYGYRLKLNCGRSKCNWWNIYGNLVYIDWQNLKYTYQDAKVSLYSSCSI